MSVTILAFGEIVVIGGFQQCDNNNDDSHFPTSALLSHPLEKLLDSLIHKMGMGNWAHVAKILELHELNLRQGSRQ